MRGPTFSNHLPATAADKPRKTIATVKIHTTLFKDQSSAALVTTPSRLINDGLNKLQAYTEPIQRWMPNAAGAVNQRLKPGFATI